MSTALLDEAYGVLKTRLPSALSQPRVGIVCGSGLGGLADNIQDIVLVPYEEIPGFAQSTVVGHKSSLAFGFVGEDNDTKVPVCAMLGRFHIYEGYQPSAVIFPIRLMARLGIQEIVITNAAGALKPSLKVGTIVAIHDHLALPNLTGLNALLGPVFTPDRPRFVSLSDAYSPELRRYVFLAAHELGLADDEVEEGVYATVSGPTFETPAEGRFLRNAGADVVGMSTVPEVLAAKEVGNIRILVLSLVTNPVIIPDKYRSIKEEVAAELAGTPIEPAKEETVDHASVLAVGQAKAQVMSQLVQKVIQKIASKA